ncbi:hypothetical protein [Sorangium sp. So ce1000]|uniref:hypothetical protein n=1 Tax=Sorangium sp. So ce1000 TaxID=3133325 RepID=UPI003F634BC5
MAGEPFDLARLRLNWARAAEPPADGLPARLAAVRMPRDAYPEARALLERIRGMAEAQFPQREPTLEHFFAEATALLILMESPAEGTGQAAGYRGEDASQDAEDARTRMVELLDELTELLEVFATIGR